MRGNGPCPCADCAGRHGGGVEEHGYHHHHHGYLDAGNVGDVLEEIRRVKKAARKPCGSCIQAVWKLPGSCVQMEAACCNYTQSSPSCLFVEAVWSICSRVAKAHTSTLG